MLQYSITACKNCVALLLFHFLTILRDLHRGLVFLTEFFKRNFKYLRKNYLLVNTENTHLIHT